jgi:hypothetical protein
VNAAEKFLENGVSIMILSLTKLEDGYAIIAILESANSEIKLRAFKKLLIIFKKQQNNLRIER